MFLKHYSKPYDANFVLVEIDKMLVSSYFFIETKKTREIKKNWNQLWRHINFDVITEIKGSWCYVTMKMCELSPCNRKPYLKHFCTGTCYMYIHVCVIFCIKVLNYWWKLCFTIIMTWLGILLYMIDTLWYLIDT